MTIALCSLQMNSNKFNLIIIPQVLTNTADRRGFDVLAVVRVLTTLCNNYMIAKRSVSITI